MPDVNDLIEETYGHLLAGGREQMNRLADAYTAGGVTLKFEFTPLGAIKRGARLGIALQDFFVWDQAGADSATVIGAQNGSGAADHSIGDLVCVNPKWTPFEVFRAMNAEIRTSQIPKVTEVDLTYKSATTGYDLAGSGRVLRIRSVKRKQTGTSKYWPVIREWRDDLGNADTGDFPSGNAIHIFGGLSHDETFRVTFDEAPTVVAALGDDIATTTGLHAEAHDILPLAVAVRLNAGRPVRRSSLDAQGDTRRAGEVGVQDVLISVRNLQSLLKARIQEEKTRLNQLYKVHTPA